MPLAGTELRIWEAKQETYALRTRLERMNIFFVHKPTTMKDVRTNRNALLAESDWTQLIDAQASLTDAAKQKWLTYRQELRDMPQTHADEPIVTIQWPIHPETEQWLDENGNLIFDPDGLRSDGPGSPYPT